MHSASFLRILTVLGSILLSASSTNINPSDTADSPTARGAMRFEYKRKGFTGVRAAAVLSPLVECQGNLPPPRVIGTVTTFRSLLDWCLRGPARCTCAYQTSSQSYDVRCAMDDVTLDMVPGIVACHNQCNCEKTMDRARLEGLANAALQLSRVRAGVA